MWCILNSVTASRLAPLAVTLRAGEASDAPAISKLLIAASERHVLPELSAAGQAHYLAQITPEEVAAKLEQSASFRFYVAYAGDELVGVAALKENAHLYHLFTHNQHHRRGIARTLWQRVHQDALAAGNPGLFTVNASRYALPAYWRLGFLPLGPAAERNGICFVPMAIRLSSAGENHVPDAA